MSKNSHLSDGRPHSRSTSGNSSINGEMCSNFKFHTHNQTHPQSCHRWCMNKNGQYKQGLGMENICTKFGKDPERIAHMTVLTVVRPMIKQPKSYRGPLWLWKLRCFDHNWTHPRSWHGERVYQIWKGSEKNCACESVNGGAPMIKQPKSYRGPLWVCKLRFFAHNRTHPSFGMENICTKFGKDPERIAHMRVLTVVRPMIKQPKSYRGPLWQWKLRFFAHNRTHPRSWHGECVYQIWKGSEKNCACESVNGCEAPAPPSAPPPAPPPARSWYDNTPEPFQAAG